MQKRVGYIFCNKIFKFHKRETRSYFWFVIYVLMMLICVVEKVHWSSWIKYLIQGHSYNMTLNDSYVTKHLCNLYVKYVVLPIGMTSNNIIFLCSPHYKDCLRTELGIDNSLCNPIYITTTLSKYWTITCLFCCY